MVRNKNITLACLAALLVLSSCISLPYTTAAEEITSIAGQIAGYALPASYRQEFAVEMAGYDLVSFQGPSPGCHLYLVQAPKDVEINIPELQAQAGALEGEKGKVQLRDVRVVEQRMVTIRGESVPLLVSEGINSEDQPYREVTALFTGRGGPALVNLSSPAALWDWDLVDAFLASIE